MKCKDLLVGLLTLGTLAFSVPAFAGSFSVGANESKLINIKGVSRVAVADPNVADVIVVSPTELLLLGKKAGATNVYFWVNGAPVRHDILVNGMNKASAALVKEVLGCPNVDVTLVGGKVLLEGTVNDQAEKARCEKIASAFGEVVNLIEMEKPRQVKVECRIIEVNSSGTKNLGVTVGSGDDPSLGSFLLGQDQKNDIDKHHNERPFHWFGSYENINAQVNAMVTKGNAKVLSQPYIITMSGEKSNIFIGGQIPVPKADDGDVSIEWKDYGIKLNIEPTVQSNGSIDSKIQTEVSSLDYSNAVSQNGFSIPALATRNADTHIMMKPGMTMAIGGLISSDQSKSISKIPLLGDIPILGQFFRSTSKTKNKKEIIILLTPILVDSDYMPIMTDEARRLSRLKDEEVLQGELYVKPKKK